MKAKPIKKPKTVKSNPVEPKKPTGISSKETKERVDNSQTIQEIPPSPIVM